MFLIRLKPERTDPGKYPVYLTGNSFGKIHVLAYPNREDAVQYLAECQWLDTDAFDIIEFIEYNTLIYRV
jgi:hypothetical protein